MTGFVTWGAATLIASALLMLLVLLVRTPMRRWTGPRLGYALWAIPALRLVMPPLAPGNVPLAGAMSNTMAVLFTGPGGSAALLPAAPSLPIGTILFAVWAAGAAAVFALYAIRHVRFCHRVRASGIESGRIDGIAIITADVEGPLAFGVLHPVIAVPRDFARAYASAERALALAHEAAHHRRGDLIANWMSLIVLAAHWWNPLAWLAIRAFREDQEFAADAAVLATQPPGAVALYARVLAKAAGVGALPASNLNTRVTLKGRLMILGQKPLSARRLAVGAASLALLGSAAIAATAQSGAQSSATGRQVVTIGVMPDGKGGQALIIGGKAVPPLGPLPGGATLPGDFNAPDACRLEPGAKPHAMVIKGVGETRTYTVMCASAAPATIRAVLAEGLASLARMRASVASQPASAVFPETERAHALGAIDGSIREIETTLATAG